jgi:transcriptional regulator with XRE-family HTH domain
MPVDALTRALRRALREAPCSARELAREAGVPHSTLVRVLAGARNATPVVAAAIAQALKTWGKRCVRLATAIENATKRHQGG